MKLTALMPPLSLIKRTYKPLLCSSVPTTVEQIIFLLIQFHMIANLFVLFYLLLYCLN